MINIVYISVVAIFILIVHLLFGVVYLYLTWYHNYWHKRGVVTATPLTLLGTYPSLLTHKRNFVHDIQDIYDKYKGKHRAVGVFLMRTPQLLILDPALARDVLVKNFSNFRDSITSSFVSKSDKYVRLNPFWAEGDFWKRQRMAGQAGLTPYKIKQAYPIWQESAKKLVNYIADQKNNVIESKDLCYRFTAAVMSDFIWGIDAGTLTPMVQGSSTILTMLSNWTTYAFNMMAIYFSTLIAPFVRKLLGLRFYPKDTDAFFSKLTKDSIELRGKTQAQQNRSDYLNYLLQMRDRKGLEHDDLVGHALTVMLDGYETSGSALLHAIYYLSEFPEAQEKLRSEILSNINVDNSINFETLNTLPYLDQCVYECLRLASVIPSYSKICTKTTTIEFSTEQNVTIEPGTFIMVPAYQFHHDGKYFPDAEEFKPERFDNNQHNEFTKKGVLLPFGDGPRVCMGSRVGLLLIKTALVAILTQFEIVRSQIKVEKTDSTGFAITLSGDILLQYKKL